MKSLEPTPFWPCAVAALGVAGALLAPLAGEVELLFCVRAVAFEVVPADWF